MFNPDFFKKESFLDLIDPRIRILFVFLFATIVATSHTKKALIFSGIFIISILIFGSVKKRDLFKRLLIVNTFTIFLVIILPFTYPGRPIYSFGPLSLTKEGLLYASTIFFKSNIILACLILFLSNLSIFTLSHALHHLRLSDKLVQIIFFSFRYLHVIQKEYKKILCAMKMRGFVPRTNFHTYKTYAYLITNLLLKSYDRSERVYKALICRGFNGTFPIYRHFKLSLGDKLFATFAMLYLFLLAYLAWG